VVLKFGCKVQVLKRRFEHGLETSQMELLRPLSGSTKLDQKGNRSIRDKLGIIIIISSCKL
jgi:hypothetical protein